MKLQISILLFFFLAINLISSAKTTIKINFPGSQGRKALLWTYSDFISYQQIKNSETTIDSNGKFNFSLTNSQITFVTIQVEFLKIEFYVEPDMDFEIDVDKVDFNNRDLFPQEMIGYLNPQFKIVKPTKHELNSELAMVTKVFDSFFDTAYLYLYQSRLPQETVEIFKAQADSIKSIIKSDFVKKFIEIQLANLDLITRKVNTKYIVDNYFKSTNILYNNRLYMDFFNSFWSKYLLTSIKGLKYGELDSVINNGQSYYSLTRLIEKDEFLKEPKLRELVVLRNLNQMYADRRFSKVAIQNILSDIAAKGLNAENKKIATNIRKSLMWNAESKAADFALPSFNNEIYSLKSFEGKYIYLNFWDDKCPKCLAEMDLEKELVYDFDDIINFVSVYVGPDTNLAKTIIENRDYKWINLYYNHDFEFLRNYKAEILPLHILIDKNSNMEWFPAALPSEDFKNLFLEMLNEKKGNLK